MKDVIPEDLLNEEPKKEIVEYKKTQKSEKMAKRENLSYKTIKYIYIYDFHQFETARSFAKIFLHIKD